MRSERAIRRSDGRIRGCAEGMENCDCLLQCMPPRFCAANYDRLVDSPFEVGTFREDDFDEGGARYRVVVDADPSDYDMGNL